MASERHEREARRLLGEACGVHLNTITAAMIAPWAAALAAAERRGAEAMREAAADVCEWQPGETGALTAARDRDAIRALDVYAVLEGVSHE